MAINYFKPINYVTSKEQDSPVTYTLKATSAEEPAGDKGNKLTQDIYVKVRRDYRRDKELVKYKFPIMALGGYRTTKGVFSPMHIFWAYPKEGDNYMWTYLKDKYGLVYDSKFLYKWDLQ